LGQRSTCAGGFFAGSRRGGSALLGLEVYQDASDTPGQRPVAGAPEHAGDQALPRFLGTRQGAAVMGANRNTWTALMLIVVPVCFDPSIAIERSGPVRECLESVPVIPAVIPPAVTAQVRTVLAGRSLRREQPRQHAPMPAGRVLHDS
jgi:hypothetical protein